MILTEEKLEKLLVGGKLIKPREFELAKEKAKAEKWSIPDAVVELGFTTDPQMGKLIADELKVEFVDLTKESIEHAVLTLLPESVSEGQATVAFRRDQEGVWLATSHPENYEFFKLVEKRLMTPLRIVYATGLGLQEALKAYQKDVLEQIQLLLQQMKHNPQDQDVVKLVQLIMASAYEYRASDVHIEPEKDEAIVRFRIDGNMHEMLRYPIVTHEKVVFRIKILSRLRTDEHAQAQDGRFEMRFTGSTLNLRVSILPITHGENVVMRLLSERFQKLRLEDLGFSPKDLLKVKRAAEMPHGMILAAGPTGSGKTTSLYAIIHILNQPDVNVTTIEDPVEYDIRGVRQIQVNTRTNLTFDAGLRSIVRQDPDVIMVGEIRDAETASIAVNAALTGHLLLSTLHANDAATVFPRLFEMNVEPFLIASSVNVIIAQRLVRRICPNCKDSYKLTEEEIDAIERDKGLHEALKRQSKLMDIKKMKFSYGKGCHACNNIGFQGRMGIYEIMEITEELRPLIVNKASSDEIRKKAVELGMSIMIEDGIEKVFKGDTTIGEIIRATKS